MTERETVTVRGEKLPEPPRVAHDRDHRSGGRAVYRPDVHEWGGADRGLIMLWYDGDRVTKLLIPESQIHSIQVTGREAEDG